MKQLTLTVANLEETEKFGRDLGRYLLPNTLISLNGPLGAGKTHLVKALAEGLDIVNSGKVTSPTFGLIQEYPARLMIYHFDVYRLPNEAAFLDLGPYEYYEMGGVCLIEWGDRVKAHLPDDRIEIHIIPLDEQHRRIQVVATGTISETILDRFTEKLKGSD